MQAHTPEFPSRLDFSFRGVCYSAAVPESRSWVVDTSAWPLCYASLGNHGRAQPVTDADGLAPSPFPIQAFHSADDAAAWLCRELAARVAVVPEQARAGLRVLFAQAR